MKKILQRRNLSALSVALIGLAALITSGCGAKGEHTAAAAQPPPPTVIVTEVKQETVPIYSEYVGQTRADNTVELRARVEGVLLKVYLKE